MKNLKKLTLLHSNDLHGDFTAEQVDEKLVGGVSLLSGYVNMVRNEKRMSSTPSYTWVEAKTLSGLQRPDNVFLTKDDTDEC